MATIEFTINMNCEVGYDQDTEVFVSHCPTLDVYSQGETEEEALDAIKSAVTLHVTTAFDFQRLDRVLRKAGFEKIESSGAERPATDSREFVSVRVKPEMKQVPISLPLRLSSAQQPQYACAR